MSADIPGMSLPQTRNYSTDHKENDISIDSTDATTSRGNAIATKEATLKDESVKSEAPHEFPEFYKIQCQFADSFHAHGALVEKRMSKTPPLGIGARRRPSRLNPPQSGRPNTPEPSSVATVSEEKVKSSQPLSQSEVLDRPDIYLSDEQKAVLHRVLTSRSSIFFTGAAGTGKSVLSRCIIRELKQRYTEPNAVAVTATTGIAACHIGGLTLHSWAGIGLGKDPASVLVTRIERNTNSVTHWRMCKVLVIDEVSMLSFDLLEKLNYIGQAIRGNSLPFGGIQVILTGDMFQLPPVNRELDPDEKRRYCFEADCWDELVNKTYKLTKVFRQTDSKFANMLNDLRFGKVSTEANEEFKGLCRPAKVPKGIRATKLYPLRKDVDNANDVELDRLDGATFEYHAKDEGSANAKKAGISMDYGLAPNKIRLKVGAQVMMIKNMNGKLVNGSIGKVLGFASESAYGPTKTGKDDGSEFDVKAMGGKEGDGTSRKERRLAYLTRKDPNLDDVKWPWVRFLAPDGTSQTVLVKPEKWEIRDTDDQLLAARSQIPLILAWAMSIHKSQGQTLPYVSINLEKTFEKGQAYVAISRATCLDGLHLSRFDRRHVRVDHRVVEFYEDLDAISTDEIERATHYFENEYVLEVKAKKQASYQEPIPEMDDQSDPDYIPSSLGSSLPHKRPSIDILEDGSMPMNPEEYLPLSSMQPNSRRRVEDESTSQHEAERDSYIIHSAVQYFPPRKLPPRAAEGTES